MFQDEFNISQNVRFTKRFTDARYTKSSSFFNGTSPEFELAAYTLCFMKRRSDRGNERCNLLMNGHIIPLDTIKKNDNAILTAYPFCPP